MPVDIRFTERGALNVIREFEETGGRAADLSPAAETIHQILLRAEELQYQYGGRRGQHRWAPLTRDWIRRKRAMGYRTKKGIMTGAIMESLTNPSDANHVFHTTNSEVIFGSDDPKMEILQDEHAANRDTVPYRPPIDLAITDVRKLTQAVESYIVGRRLP